MHSLVVVGLLLGPAVSIPIPPELWINLAPLPVRLPTEHTQVVYVGNIFTDRLEWDEGYWIAFSPMYRCASGLDSETVLADGHILVGPIEQARSNYIRILCELDDVGQIIEAAPICGSVVVQGESHGDPLSVGGGCDGPWFSGASASCSAWLNDGTPTCTASDTSPYRGKPYCGWSGDGVGACAFA